MSDEKIRKEFKVLKLGEWQKAREKERSRERN